MLQNKIVHACQIKCSRASKENFKYHIQNIHIYLKFLMKVKIYNIDTNEINMNFMYNKCDVPAY